MIDGDYKIRWFNRVYIITSILFTIATAIGGWMYLVNRGTELTYREAGIVVIVMLGVVAAGCILGIMMTYLVLYVIEKVSKRPKG